MSINVFDIVAALNILCEHSQRFVLRFSWAADRAVDDFNAYRRFVERVTTWVGGQCAFACVESDVVLFG